MNLKKIVDMAIDLAQEITEDAWQPVTVKLSPDHSGYDPVTETGGDSWGFDGELTCLIYEEIKTSDNSIEDKQKMLLIQSKDLDGFVVDESTAARFTINGATYSATGAAVDPIRATFIFKLQA